MASVIIRNLPEEVHRALRARAARHGNSTEAEIRAILKNTVQPEGRIKLGSILAEIGREADLTDEDFAVIEQVRDKSPAKPPGFE